jgi:hypothetical protein
VRLSSSSSGGSSFPCSAEMQQALIFWPLHPLVLPWPRLALCASVPLRTGGMGAQIYVERGLSGIVTVTLPL